MPLVLQASAAQAMMEAPAVKTFMESLRDPECAIAVAAIQALTTIIENSKASTGWFTPPFNSAALPCGQPTGLIRFVRPAYGVALIPEM